MNVFAPVAIYGFWALLLVGWRLDELRVKSAAVFVLLWLAGFVGTSLAHYGALFLPYVALLDVALVLVIFKGDVTLR